MREKSADLLTKKQVDVDPVIYFNFVPVVDHKFLEKSPLELLKSTEEFQRKNIMLGMNSHEGSYFIIYDFPTRFDPLKSNIDSITAEEYREMVKKLKLVNTSSDAVIDTIAAVYSLPCGSEGNSNDVDAKTYLMSLDGMFGDSWFKCPVVHTAKTYATKVNSICISFLPDQYFKTVVVSKTRLTGKYGTARALGPRLEEAHS